MEKAPNPGGVRTCCGVEVKSVVFLPKDQGAVSRERLYWRWPIDGGPAQRSLLQELKGGGPTPKRVRRG